MTMAWTTTLHHLSLRFLLVPHVWGSVQAMEGEKAHVTVSIQGILVAVFIQNTQVTVFKANMLQYLLLKHACDTVHLRCAGYGLNPCWDSAYRTCYFGCAHTQELGSA
eukprot:1158714-Pelagomonas_calceolata.AAC.13